MQSGVGINEMLESLLFLDSPPQADESESTDNSEVH